MRALRDCLRERSLNVSELVAIGFAPGLQPVDRRRDRGQHPIRRLGRSPSRPLGGGAGRATRALARELGVPKAANVVLLGFALARLGRPRAGLFCSIEDLASVLEVLPEKRSSQAAVSLKAGFERGQQQRKDG